MGLGEYDNCPVCIPLRSEENHIRHYLLLPLSSNLYPVPDCPFVSFIRVQQGIQVVSGISLTSRSPHGAPLGAPLGSAPEGALEGDGFYNINTSNPARFPRSKSKKDGSSSDKNSDTSSDRNSNRIGINENRSDSRGRSDYESGAGGLTLPPALLPPGSLLRKGYQRACILCPSSSGLIAVKKSLANSTANTNNTSEIEENSTDDGASDQGASQGSHGRAAVFEVIIHDGEAFLKRRHVEIGGAEEASRSTPGNQRILDFSTGWQHSLMVLD